MWLQSENVLWNVFGGTPLSHWSCESSLEWWQTLCAILPTDTCLKVRGHLVRGNPNGNLTRLRDSGNQVCSGEPNCPLNSPTNHILIEFQGTCKNLVQFCYFHFPNRCPCDPWKVICTGDVFCLKTHTCVGGSKWKKVKPCACPQDGCH